MCRTTSHSRIVTTPLVCTSAQYVEFFLLYFIHFPVSVVRRQRLRGESNHSRPSSSSSWSEAWERGRARSLLFRSVQDLKTKSPYVTLVHRFINHHIPRDDPDDADAAQGAVTEQQPLTPLAPFIVQAIADFWLAQNGPGLVLDDSIAGAEAPGKHIVKRHERRSRMTRAASYDEVSTELLHCVMVLITHLLDDFTLPRSLALLARADVLGGAVSRGVGAWWTAEPAVASVPELQGLHMLHAPFYHFFRVNMKWCQINVDSSVLEDLVDTWLAYLTPWRAPHRFQPGYVEPQKSGLSATRALTSVRSQEAAMEWGDFGSRRYKGYKGWEPFIMHHFTVSRARLRVGLLVTMPANRNV